MAHLPPALTSSRNFSWKGDGPVTQPLVSNVTLATNGHNNGSKALVVAAIVDSEVLPPAQGALLSLTFLAGLLLLVFGIHGDSWKALITCEMSVRGRSSSKKAANGKELSEEELKKEFEFSSSDSGEPDKIQLYTLSKSRLKAECRNYRLPVSGNMGVLLDRLIDYSSKKDKWHKTQAGARCKHKSMQLGSKKKALKSYERHRLQKESGILTLTLATVEQLRKDTCTKAEKIARLEMARQYQRDHPKYQEPLIRQPLHSTQLNPFSALANINNKVDTLAWLIQQQSLHSGLWNGTTVVT
uniref:SAP domain-containing protein n=1 Tax=Moniliophthora roreri TaxID=221103 RepID=A0A0W0G1P1_MONRR